MLPIYQYKDIRIVKTKMVAIPWLNLFAIIPVGWVLGIAGEVMSLSFAISAFWAMVLTCLAFLVRKLKINKILSSRTSSHIGSPTKAEFDTCIDRSFINSFYSDSKTDKVTIQPFDDSIAGTPNLKRSFFNEMPKYMLFDLVVEDFDSKGRKANIYYATLCEIKLRQPVINLIFDSRSARGSQFKVWLLRSQRLKMPLEFEKHFTTYSPKYHAIETLQLITPEVLEAMIDLKDSDIEFVGDSLLCFGPLLPIKQLADFRSRCLTLHDKVTTTICLISILKVSRSANSVVDFSRTLSDFY